ncbi:MAG: efflux RND transporter periplasmic adaptor subunit [Limnothrix sp. RL_2_0]|nr:efflux RND transporter periplasmic adaptor subunit [Limnothrix sp. RL_2_0]
MSQHLKASMGIWLVLPLLWLPIGCSFEKQSNAQSAGDRGDRPEQPPLVEIATVTLQNSATSPSYTGTTAPLKIVALRSRTEGQLLDLAVDVGDGVTQGQTLARLDQNLLIADYNEAIAELASREFEVNEAKAELAQVVAQVDQAKAQLKQAEADAARFKDLAKSGAVSEQAGEVAETAKVTAEKILQATQQQINIRKQAIAAAEGRVLAQRAIVNQTTERLNYTILRSPLGGVVLSKTVEAGDVIQPGQALLEIGDLSGIKIEVQISDRELNQFSLGQNVSVNLDAFPGKTFQGEVTQISPVADAAARLIPIEITIPNSGNQISSGLLARVSGAGGVGQAVIVPESAIQQQNNQLIIFTAKQIGDTLSVESRTVQVGQTDNGFVEILSGLNVGEVYVTESDRPLESGQTVRKSLLSD